MASASLCDPCIDENKSVSATHYCSDCEERLCTSCVDSHGRFRAFKSHHVNDLSSFVSNIPVSVKKICNVHPDMLLDYYCTDHDIVCCRACIPKEHRKCENVLPLEHASQDVKKSALFSDTMADIKHLITTLNDLHDNRESNLKSLLKTKSVITKQIREVKSRLLKEIDDAERDLQAKLSSLNRKHVIEINKQKEEISQVLDSLKLYENEVGFLKDHGSNNQLFIWLHQQVQNIQSTEASVEQMISNSEVIEITFDEKKDVKLDLFGPLSESVSSCQVQYKPNKLPQAQMIAQSTKHIAGFEMDAELHLKKRMTYSLIDVCVTDDNKLLLTNFSELNVYRDCTDYETGITFSVDPFGVAVIPDTDRAVVTLPTENSIQFINTTKMTKGHKVKVGFKCSGITAERDRVYVGGEGGTIKTLDTNGTILKSIKQGHGRSSDIGFLSFDDFHKQFIVRCLGKLLCINLDGKQVYSKDVSGRTGVARDRQGNIYFSSFFSSNIQRISSNGEHCEEMLNEDNGIRNPYGMCFNNDFTKLFVINDIHRSVNVYNCK